MLKLWAVLLGIALWSIAAQAQAQTATLSFPPCPAPNYYSSADGKTFTCTVAPVVTGGPTYTPGSGISISSANVISTTFPVTTLASARPVAPGDGTHTLSYNSTAPGAFALPAAGTVANGWAVCFYVRGSGAITLSVSTGVAVYGGPIVLTQRQFECAQADDAGGWLLSGGSAVIPNPNPFQ
jgi:hypothetical protein